jgi:hypothetical protein
MPTAPYTEEYSNRLRTSFIIAAITFITEFTAALLAIAALEDYIFSTTIKERL